MLELLEAAFARHKDRAALEWGNRRVSYATLEVAANKLANALIASGVSPGSVVGVLLHERVDIVAALIGVLRAGAAFVPLDPAFPMERLRQIAAELEDPCLITEPSLADLSEAIFAGGPAPRAKLQLEWQARKDEVRGLVLPQGWKLEDFAAEKPGVATDIGAMAYVYFTSGSTGRPKGVAGTLKGLSHFINWEMDKFALGEGWRFSQFTAPIFDAFLRDVLVPLCTGGVVSIPSRLRYGSRQSVAPALD